MDLGFESVFHGARARIRVDDGVGRMMRLKGFGEMLR